MRSTIGAGAARDTRGLAPHLRFILRIRQALAQVTASRWASPLGRIALFAGGLVVLALIGDSALARGPSALASVPPVAPTPTTEPHAPVAVFADAGAAAPIALTASSPPASPPPAQAREGSARGRATPDDPVVLNSASIDDLQRLPGVGPKRARAIFDLRAHIGRFRRVEDLLRVKGIGRATLKKLRPLVRIDAPETPAPARADAGSPSS